MKELSLNILDIAKNSVKAGATVCKIEIIEDDEDLTLRISDDGCGMTEEFLKNVTDPFCTTRTTRAVGLGIPLLKLEAEQTGGSFKIESRHESKYPDSHGTVTQATFYKNHIDMTPLGDVISSVVTLIQGDPQMDFEFVHTLPGREIRLDTRELREVLGDEVPLDLPDVLVWIRGNLEEQYRDASL